MNVFIFHRDLRIHDNTALIKLHEYGDVTPIFIFTPEQIDKKTYFSNNSVQFMVESLHELSSDIKQNGGHLNMFHGHTMDVLKSLNGHKKINSISYNIDYTPYAKKRDDEIRKFCKNNDIKCIECEDYPLFDILGGQTKKANGTPYLVFTPFKNHCLTLPVRHIDKFKSWNFTKRLQENKSSIDEKAIDKYYKENKDINIHGGRKNGLSILGRINDFNNYDTQRDKMTYKTTFLSAHNHFGTISIREVYGAVDKLSGKTLLSELIWRDFYLNITHEFPHILKGQISGKNLSYKKEYDNIKWSYNKKLFSAWCEGKTGFPIVDACMRQLNTTGFMHNRGRMICASFLTKDLHIDWRLGEQYFATQLVDYDAAMNNNGWTWTTGNGTDASKWFRIFNPWLQSKKFDHDAVYIKKWVTELSDVSAKDIHNWFKEKVREDVRDEVKIKYPDPIIDHDVEKKITLKLYKEALS